MVSYIETMEGIQMKRFDTIDDLINDLGIGRATVYRRAKRFGISLSNVSEGISDEDYLKLTKPLQKNNHVENFENNEKYRIEVLSLKENIETLETEIKSQNKRYEDERKRNDQRETELLEKLSNEQNLLSQSQQLQLLTEQRLHDAENRIKLLESPKQEQKKGFWARLFG